MVVRYECSPPSALLVRFLSPPSHTYPSLRFFPCDFLDPPWHGTGIGKRRRRTRLFPLPSILPSFHAPLSLIVGIIIVALPPSQHVGIQEGRATGPVVVFFFLLSPPPFASFGGCPTDDACVLRTKGGRRNTHAGVTSSPPLSTHCCCCSRDRGTGV